MYKAFIFFVLITLSLHSLAQERNYSVNQFNTRQYSLGEGTTYSIVQDKRGLIYAGTANGILEFDGYSWRFIKVKFGAWVFSLACDSSGKILIGSQNEFGFLEPDLTGTYTYHSLSDSLKEEERNFGSIWKIHVTNFGEVYQSENRIFIFRNGSLKVIQPETSFHLSFYLNDTLFVRERKVGLMKFKDGKLIPVKNGAVFSNIGIFSMLSINNTAFIASQQDGIFRYNYKQGATSLYPEPGLVYKNLIIHGGIVLCNHDIAYNTLNNGIVILDPESKKLTSIKKEDGIVSNRVNDLLQDNQNNLWLATNKGVDRIDYTSPFSYFKDESGLEGNVFSIVRFNGLLYVGTSEGLFIQNSNYQANNKKRFYPVTSFETEVRNIIVADGSLLVSTKNELFSFSNNSPVKISNIPVNCLYYSEKNNILITATKSDIFIYKNIHTWKQVAWIPEIKVEINSINENRSFKEGSEFWMGTSYQGVVRLRILKPYQKFNYTLDYFAENEGLPNDWVFPFEYNDRIVFGNQKGLMVIKEEKVEVTPDSVNKDSILNIRYAEPWQLPNFSTKLPVNILQDSRSKIWLSVDNELKYLEKNDSNRLVSQPFFEVDMGKINIIYPEEGTGITWIGADDGLVRFDEMCKKNFQLLYRCLIRKVQSGNDSVLFGGSYFIYSPHTKERIISDYQDKNSTPSIAYTFNTLTFEFSAPYFSSENKILYSYKLDGMKMNENWSEWSGNTSRNYTNIYEGRYTFHVKAKNIYGVESSEATYSFVILAPWYRTIWAYLLYAIILVFIIYIAVILGRLRLKAKNIILEAKVKERTMQIMIQKEQIEKQNNLIKQSIKYAQHIQKAVQPLQMFVDEIVPEHFVLLRPCEIVSGDFFWMGRKHNLTFVAAVDGTGHGVPGAFITMLGSALLNEILANLKYEEISADYILNTLRNKVIKTLHQRGKEGEIQDGMDLALCIIDFDNMQLQYAGAYNPLYLFRNNTLNEIEANSMPIGIHINDCIGFTNHKIQLEKNDALYIFSDGYVSQFGGPDGNEKFKRKRFKQLLTENCSKPMPEQRQILEARFLEWKGEQDQTDDVLVIGIRI
jgi:serine phosphatase RsbU (regulator of sigma subunit)